MHRSAWTSSTSLCVRARHVLSFTAAALSFTAAAVGYEHNLRRRNAAGIRVRTRSLPYVQQSRNCCTAVTQLCCIVQQSPTAVQQSQCRSVCLLRERSRHISSSSGCIPSAHVRTAVAHVVQQSYVGVFELYEELRTATRRCPAEVLVVEINGTHRSKNVPQAKCT